MESNNTEFYNTTLHSLLAKIKCRKVLREFLFTMGYFLPDFTSFSHEFVFLWLQGKKFVSKIII